MTKEARRFLIKGSRGFNKTVDEAYAIIPEGMRRVAVGRVMLYSKKKNEIYVVWRRNNGSLSKKLLKESKEKEIHIAQVIIERNSVIVFIDAGEGFSKMHTMEKIVIPFSELQGFSYK